MNHLDQHSIQRSNSDVDHTSDPELHTMQQSLGEMTIEDIEQLLCSVSDNGQTFDTRAEDPNTTEREVILSSI